MQKPRLRTYIGPRSLSLAAVSAALSLGLTGCAHDRHTGAVIGGVVGATIGYVIATEHEKSNHYEHHPYHKPHAPKKRHYPSRHAPYCH